MTTTLWDVATPPGISSCHCCLEYVGAPGRAGPVGQFPTVAWVTFRALPLKNNSGPCRNSAYNPLITSRKLEGFADEKRLEAVTDDEGAIVLRRSIFYAVYNILLLF